LQEVMRKIYDALHP